MYNKDMKIGVNYEEERIYNVNICIYILLVFFLLLLGTMLVVLNNTRLLANKIKENTDGNIDFNLVLKGDKEIFIEKIQSIQNQDV